MNSDEVRIHNFQTHRAQNVWIHSTFNTCLIDSGTNSHYLYMNIYNKVAVIMHTWDKDQPVNPIKSNQYTQVL